MGRKIALLLILMVCGAAGAQEAAGDAAEPAAVPYSRDGADTCLRCHGEGEDDPVLAIFQTRHGHRGDPRAPFGPGGLQCEACHGPGGEHAGRVRRGQERPAIGLFAAGSKATAEQENGACLGCHESDHPGWTSSVHANNELSCTSCHRVHIVDDAVLDTRTQPEVCYDCHREQRADSLKTSTHPLRYGKIACSDCHQPHDSTFEHSLTESTVNETCYGCHAEKRGPHLWEHPPVEEDCGLCHRPHGSNHAALLKVRSPLLCQQCHSRADHASLALTGNELPGGTGDLRSAFLVSRGCGNCHSQVHGSNHPSGVNLTR